MPSTGVRRGRLLQRPGARPCRCRAGDTVSAQAQTTKIRFQLDWRFEGPAALFLAPKSKGYFEQEKLDVTIDAGNGSGNAVNRVASGAYEMGFADLAALMEFWGNNANAPSKPVAVMMVYNNTPAAVFALKKSNIKAPADLTGKKLGAPVFDAGRKAFPIFAAANSLDESKMTWISMDPPLRETMLANGQVDAITGFYFTSLLNLNARGVKDEDVVIMPYPQFGVKLYGNVVIASEKFVKENPQAVRAFLRGAHPRGQGRTRRSRWLDQVGQGARRHHRRGARAAAAAIGDPRLDQHRRCPQRRLRRSQWTAAGTDDIAGRRRIQAQGPTRPDQAVHQRLPAAEGRAQHPQVGRGEA